MGLEGLCFKLLVKNSIDRPDSDSEYIFVHLCMIQKLCVEKKWLPPGLSIEILGTYEKSLSMVWTISWLIFFSIFGDGKCPSCFWSFMGIGHFLIAIKNCFPLLRWVGIVYTWYNIPSHMINYHNFKINMTTNCIIFKNFYYLLKQPIKILITE